MSYYGDMGRIFVLCPSTGRPVDTGMSLSSHAFSSYEPKNARSFCPHCQRTHRWTKDGMVLRDDEAETSASR